MEKEHITRYPTIELNQRDLTQALSSMLNCRRYLESLGFQEKIYTDDWYEDTNGISGSIFFPDGSEVSNNVFQKTTSNRDALLERMISKGVTFQRRGFDYDRSKIVRTSFEGDWYLFNLDVRDTTRERWPLILRPFVYTPRRFASEVYINLTKSVISDKDLEEFTKYAKGLEDAMRQETLLTYSPQVPRRKSTQTQDVDTPREEIHFINPWEVQIPKLGKND